MRRKARPKKQNPINPTGTVEDIVNGLKKMLEEIKEIRASLDRIVKQKEWK